MATLADALFPGACIAIAGLPGVGKTQIALHVAQTLPDSVHHRFFLRASDTLTMTLDYSGLSQALGLPVAQNDDPSLAYAALYRWFRERDDWFALYDNADDPAVFDAIPLLSGKGRTLITSRDDAIAAYADTIPVEVLGEEAAVRALRRYAGKNNAKETTVTDAEAICAALQYLPVAIVQAGMYCLETKASFSDYLKKLQEQPASVYAWTSKIKPKALRAVAQTFPFALDWVEKRNPRAADLLRRAAFLAADDIYADFFVDFGEERQAALGLCARFGLVTLDEAHSSFSLHRLTREVMRHTIPSDARRAHLESVCDCVSSAYPPDGDTKWDAAKRWLPHATDCAAAALDCAASGEDAAVMFIQLGFQQERQGRFTEALPLLERSLAINESALGEEHPLTALSLNNLAGLYRATGQFEEALPLYERSLAIRESALGEQHPDTGVSLNNLAALYQDTGRFEEALPLYERSLAIRESALGEQHPDTGVSLNNLAALYQDTGRLAEALPLYQRALAIRELVLGEQHPDTGVSLNNLAGLYRATGRLTEALPLLERSLAIRESALGEEHPLTATALNNLAGLYQDTGRFEEALPLYERSLAIYESLLGKEHPDTGVSLWNLAVFHQQRGASAIALPLIERAANIFLATLGEQHPNTINLLTWRDAIRNAAQKKR